MRLGFLRAVFRPTDEVCAVRAVARQRDVLLTEQTSGVPRRQKALVQMNIRLTEVLRDVMGLTGEAIIRDIVGSERDPKVLARDRDRHSRSHVEASQQDQALGQPGQADAGDGGDESVASVI